MSFIFISSLHVKIFKDCCCFCGRWYQYGNHTIIMTDNNNKQQETLMLLYRSEWIFFFSSRPAVLSLLCLIHHINDFFLFVCFIIYPKFHCEFFTLLKYIRERKRGSQEKLWLYIHGMGYYQKVCAQIIQVYGQELPMNVVECNIIVLIEEFLPFITLHNLGSIINCFLYILK